MAEEKKHRPLSQNDHEIQLLKDAFADNELLLKSVRSLFLGFSITKDQGDLVKSVFKDPNLRKALRRKMFPTITEDVPIGEASDFWFGTETEIIGQSPEAINQVVESKQKTLDMLEQAFSLFDDPLGTPVSIEFKPRTENDPYRINLLARNKYIKSVETGLAIVKVIAGQKNETVEEAKQRLSRDSAK